MMTILQQMEPAKFQSMHAVLSLKTLNRFSKTVARNAQFQNYWQVMLKEFLEYSSLDLPKFGTMW
jgi:DNA topoisomerase IA